MYTKEKVNQMQRFQWPEKFSQFFHNILVEIN